MEINECLEQCGEKRKKKKNKTYESEQRHYPPHKSIFRFGSKWAKNLQDHW